jgi:diguanylate cyclase (GGDEF)-like protein
LSNTEAQAAKNVANRLRVAVSQLACEGEKHTFGYTISLGIAQLGADDTAFTLFDKADKALYQAKEAGRNAVVCCA